MGGLNRCSIRQCAKRWQPRANLNGCYLHTFLILLCGVALLAAIVMIVCYINDDNMMPVGKASSSVFVALVALILTCNTVLDHPQVSGYQRLAQLQQIEQARTDQVIEAQASEPGQSGAPAAAPIEQRQAAAPAQYVAAAPAAAVPAAAPAADSTFKDMALGGALGYLAGSAGRNNGGSHTVTHVVHEPSPPPAARTSWSPSPRPRVAAVEPAVRQKATPDSRPTIRNTFRMTRRR